MVGLFSSFALSLSFDLGIFSLPPVKCRISITRARVEEGQKELSFDLFFALGVGKSVKVFYFIPSQFVFEKIRTAWREKVFFGMAISIILCQNIILHGRGK